MLTNAERLAQLSDLELLKRAADLRNRDEVRNGRAYTATTTGKPVACQGVRPIEAPNRFHTERS